jgi:regulator of protease activity HflC (stomatin/prohibitin superfamily)
MSSILVIVGTTAVVGTALAALLGWLGQPKGRGGAILLGTGTALASGICQGGLVIGHTLAGNTGGWVGLVVGMLVAGIVVPWHLGKLVRGRSGRFMAGMWFGHCLLWVIGYLAGGWLGLLTITLPAVVIFWIGLYRISVYILPPDHKVQRSGAFRCLMTFHMGTNYPYYFVKDGEVEKRVEGNPYLLFFAGPGIVYTDSAHATYVTDGITVKGVFEPGLSFPGLYDQEPRALDLRPQLRAFYVEALTKDGIPVEVLVFIPFRVHTAGQKADFGKSFPFRRLAVFEIIAGELVERSRTQRDGEKHRWNEGLVPLVVTPIVQDVVSQYGVDELCAPLEPNRDPRREITDEIESRAKKELLKRGIEVIGGGIGNLLPQDRSVLEGRVDCWQSQWERTVISLKSESEAAQARLIEMARAEACRDIVLRLSQIIERSGEVSHAALALRFIDCLGEICETEVRLPVPGDVKTTLRRLQSGLEEQTPATRE